MIADREIGMTRYCTVVATIAIVVASTVIVDAEPEETRARVELNLTEDQRASLKTLDGDMKTQLKDIASQVQAGDLSREEARGLRQGVKDEFRTSRQSVFTAEQLQLMEAHRAGGEGHGAWGPGRGRGRGKGRGEGRPEGAAFGEELGLNASQTEQLETMRGLHRTAMDALRESETATREDFQQLRETQRQEVGGILTEEQRLKLDEKRSERTKKREGRGQGRHGGGRRRGGGRSK